MQANPAAQLVAGATEIGVELNKKFKAFPLLISTEGVPELTRITSRPGEWRIGGAATLTVVEEAVAGEFPSLAKMLRVFASRQIRNRATLGGNLATASPIGDSAPVLLSLDATLVLATAAGERTVPLAEFFVAYRKTVLQRGEVIREIVIPRVAPAPGLTRHVDFLKVSKRRELDISIVAAAFCVDVDGAGVVRRARLRLRRSGGDFSAGAQGGGGTGGTVFDRVGHGGRPDALARNSPRLTMCPQRRRLSPRAAGGALAKIRLR